MAGNAPIVKAQAAASMYARRISNGHVMPVTVEEFRFHADNMLDAIQKLTDDPKIERVGWVWNDIGRLHSDRHHHQHEHPLGACSPVFTIKEG